MTAFVMLGFLAMVLRVLMSTSAKSPHTTALLLPRVRIPLVASFARVLLDSKGMESRARPVLPMRHLWRVGRVCVTTDTKEMGSTSAKTWTSVTSLHTTVSPLRSVRTLRGASRARVRLTPMGTVCLLALPVLNMQAPLKGLRMRPRVCVTKGLAATDSQYAQTTTSVSMPVTRTLFARILWAVSLASAWARTTGTAVCVSRALHTPHPPTGALLWRTVCVTKAIFQRELHVQMLTSVSLTHTPVTLQQARALTQLAASSARALQTTTEAEYRVSLVQPLRRPKRAAHCRLRVCVMSGTLATLPLCVKTSMSAH
eukprot:Rmarinus@m.5257